MIRTSLRGLGAVALAALSAGCQCNPSLPTDSDPPDPPPETATTADTAPEPPCAFPEQEPNDDADQANLIAPEQRACGVIGEPLDFDYFSVFLDDDGWISVEAEGDDGSIADMQLQFLSVDEGWGVLQTDAPESTDARVVFQAPMGEYTLSVGDETAQGGERFTYRVLVSEVKAPVEWSMVEVEGNDVPGDAQVLVDGDSVFGTMDGNGALEDFDWFRIAVPDGRHDVHIDVDAFSEGSGANLTAIVWDADVNELETIVGGQISGVDLDPEGVYQSSGDEVIYVELLESGSQEGPTEWYVLNITLEAV
ncbi:MAG: hypothetical protein KTR31_07605 [Myxococcales bacterium]|nr:hypothetical protein [Myxococcales bacterium]